jgi:hypothetical protein
MNFRIPMVHSYKTENLSKSNFPYLKNYGNDLECLLDQKCNL